MDIDEAGRRAAEVLRSSTAAAQTPSVAALVRRGRRRAATRAIGTAAAVVVALSGVAVAVVQLQRPARVTPAAGRLLLGQWSVSVPPSVAAQAQLPAGAWSVVVNSSVVVAEPAGQPTDRIVEQVSAGTANSHVVTFSEAAGGGFNFACTARKLFLALPWRQPSG